MKRSLLTLRPCWPFEVRGVSVHISFAFSRTMLQWRSNALTRARILRLFRHEISTCVRERTAVWRIESGPVESSCSSTWATSYSLYICQNGSGRGGGSGYVRQLRPWLGEKLSIMNQDIEYEQGVSAAYWILASTIIAYAITGRRCGVYNGRIWRLVSLSLHCCLEQLWRGQIKPV